MRRSASFRSWYDGERIEALREAVESERHEPLDLPGETIRVDTSRPADLVSLGDHVMALVG